MDKSLWTTASGLPDLARDPPPVAGAAGAAVAALNTYNPNTLHLYTPPSKNFLQLCTNLVTCLKLQIEGKSG